MASLGWSPGQRGAVVAGEQTPNLRRTAAAPLAWNLQCAPFSSSHRKRFSRLVRAAEEQALVAKPAPKTASKPVFSLTKGQIVRVDKEKYLNSVNYLSVGHPPYFKGLDYIYEDRGEVLDLRIFETGEYALVAWAGIPTSPAWLPTDMLMKAAKLNYTRT